MQSHKIETLEDLRKLAEDTKKRRSDNIHNQRELNAKLKKVSNIVDIYQAYKPYAEYLKNTKVFPAGRNSLIMTKMRTRLKLRSPTGQD